MRAAVLEEFNTVPEIRDWPDEPVDTGEHVGVRVAAAAMNPIDLLMATGAYPGAQPLPSIVGREGIGELHDGSLVYFGSCVAPFGSFAERTLVVADRTIALPAGIDPGLALCFGIAGLAGWLAVEWRAQLQPGERVLVLGASGIVGRIAIQAAKLLGAGRVIAATRSDGADLLELGADAVVDLTRVSDVPAALRAAAGGGPDVIIDPVWGEPAVHAIQSAAPNARFVQIGSSAGAEATLSAVAIRHPTLSILGFTTFATPVEVQRDAFQKMVNLGVQGKLVAPVMTFGLDDVAGVWRDQRDSPRHKLVIVL
jgi:NADPH:quinone reductase-like Zn-dependent oxidoreductase